MDRVGARDEVRYPKLLPVGWLSPVTRPITSVNKL